MALVGTHDDKLTNQTRHFLAKQLSNREQKNKLGAGPKHLIRELSLYVDVARPPMSERARLRIVPVQRVGTTTTEIATAARPDFVASNTPQLVEHPGSKIDEDFSPEPFPMVDIVSYKSSTLAPFFLSLETPGTRARVGSTRIWRSVNGQRKGMHPNS